MAKTFGWAFIGTGTLARGIVGSIMEGGRHKVVSAYSRNRERLVSFTSKCGAYPALSVEDAILQDGVDCVHISVTNESHYSVAMECLEKGKHVLLEKPFTITADETIALIQKAKEKGVYLAEAMWTWFGDVSYSVKKIFDEGRLGELKSVEMAFAEYSIGYAPRVSDPLLGGGAVLDIGIYPITYAYRVFGMPEKILCSGTVEGGIDTKEDITFVYKDFSVHMFVSIVDRKGNYLVAEGEKGTLTIPKFSTCNPGILKIGDEIIFLPGGRGYVDEFDRVADEIEECLLESR
ncbi:MAG: Gfo/Idh/MocA family oxidoreductase, partial [Spirochaetales bacterium]|nr:Gfo/Idh/MocA family oxidoreductase [Candidatus Physcosoma equi]